MPTKPLAIPRGTNASRAGCALRAWLVAVVPSLLYFFALVALGTDSLRPPPGALDAKFARYSILVAPLDVRAFRVTD
jgi:hypothetical protein